MISIGIFITMSIISFILCFTDKDIRKLNATITEKVIASVFVGMIIGVISALLEFFVFRIL